MTPAIFPYLWLGGVFVVCVGILATIKFIWEHSMKIKAVDIWPIILLTMLIVSIIGVFMTGDARWLGLGVLPCIVFAKWMRV